MTTKIRANGCQVCGRPLTSPESLAAGIGPVCGGRGYQSRIAKRHSKGVKGWQPDPAFEEQNSPCYTCHHFEVPHKDSEVEIPGGFVVTTHQRSRRFGDDAIGGYCKALKMLVDGNLIRQWTQCNSDKYQPRSVK